MSSGKPIIALVDWNWKGHHPNFFVAFCCALSDAGARILPVCSDPENFNTTLASNSSFLSPLLDHQNILDPIRFTYPAAKRLWPRRLIGIKQSVDCFGQLDRLLRRWQKKHEQRLDSVFFACIYDWEFEMMEYAQPFFRFPWMGLYLHGGRAFRMPGSLTPYSNRQPHPEKILRARQCKGIALLDEECVLGMKSLIQDRAKVIAFPDLLCQPLAMDNSFYCTLKGQANGKSIVTLAGHLHRTKGIFDFVELAKSFNKTSPLFVLAGEIGLSASESRCFYDSIKGLKNLFLLPRRLTNQELNSTFKASDVIYAAYRDFPNSSNAMVLAAHFQRPLLVSDGYLMAERTRKFLLGEVAEEGSHASLMRTLNKMLSPEYNGRMREKARWNDYNHIHSYERLVKAFKELYTLS